MTSASLRSICSGTQLSRSDDIQTHAAGPAGKLPLTDEMLRNWSSGDLFGLTQNAGMGWKPAELLGPQYLILSTQGGVRAPDGTPIALGYHTGHWEVGLLVQAAAREIEGARRRAVRRVLSPTRATAARRARPACSTACPIATTRRSCSAADPLAAAAARRDRRGDLRQGPAGDDDGPGRPPATCPACSCPAA